MTPEEAIQVADEVLLAHAGNPLTDIQRLILRESLAGKGYERMEGYAPQHLKNEGKKLWDLLSEALGEKVSKTSFRGLLEKRWKLGALIPKPPLLSIYKPQTWVGRKAIIDECLPKLQGQARILWITGISGIGKTALGECLASQTWEGDPTFQWLDLEILEGQSPEFVSVAADLLAKLGEVDLDPQERNDPKRLMERLLRKLKVSRYWLQVDSLERLLNSEQPTETEFADHHWVTFLQRCLTEPNFASRLVLTAQALPSSLAELEDRYPNLWQVITLQGLLAHQPDEQRPNEHLELFAKNGLSVDDISSIHLRRIGQIYEGHPLVLQVIAKEILAAPFDGNVTMYWERYGNEFEQVARELQAERVSPELYNQALQKRVRRRVEVSLKRLPTDALDLLCRSSVYRRPVPETFWLSLFEEQTSQQRQQAYQILNERAFVEREGIHQNQFLIRQHNLVRAVAYDLLKANTQIWYRSERQASHLWLTVYEPAPDAPNLETVRGYLEAFNHYCEIEDWNSAKELFTTKIDITQYALTEQLHIFSSYREEISLCQKLLGNCSCDVDLRCWNGIGNGYCGLGDYSKSIVAYENCLKISQELRNLQSEGQALGNLGLIYYNLGQHEHAINYQQQSLNIFREIGDRPGERLALGHLGDIYDRVGQHERAIDFQQQSLVIAREIKNRRGEGDALCGLGNAYNSLGQYEQTINFQFQSLEIFREIGNRRSEAIVLGNLGLAHANLGRYKQAIAFYLQQLEVAQEIGDLLGEGIVLSNLGNVYTDLAQYEQAINFQKRSLFITQQIGDRDGEAIALGNLGCAYSALGNYAQALELQNQKLVIAREIRNRHTESYALAGMAGVLIKLEQYKEALKALQNALEICQENGERSLEASVFKALAELHQALGEVEVARQYCQQALELATALGIPLAEECQKLKQELEKRGASEGK
jgi:tetratricopeptide (TPR) repeat protein